MNPSARGWIDKFGHLVKGAGSEFSDYPSLYQQLKETGFIYGMNVQIPPFIIPEHHLSEDEKAKINLLTGLYFVYKIHRVNSNYKAFLESVFEFYKTLEIGKSSFLDSILSGKKASAQLEKLIDTRVYLEDNVISKTFHSIITNSLLIIDVFTYVRFLKGEKHIKKIARQLEYIAINITYHALGSREKNRKDEKLAQLFESSLTYMESGKERFDASYRERLTDNFTHEENVYFLDVACFTVWEDKSLDYMESDFIYGLGKDLGIDREEIAISLSDVTRFFHENASKLPHLKDQSLGVQFYDSMAKIVNRLILRNSKRLQKELAESKELVFLLSKSTVKELSREEKKKVQNQLIDIFKSIPSLAIFILPGGAVLLPIFIKLIPKLLPSAFDENRVDEG